MLTSFATNVTTEVTPVGFKTVPVTTAFEPLITRHGGRVMSDDIDIFTSYRTGQNEYSFNNIPITTIPLDTINASMHGFERSNANMPNGYIGNTTIFRGDRKNDTATFSHNLNAVGYLATAQATTPDRNYDKYTLRAMKSELQAMISQPTQPFVDNNPPTSKDINTMDVATMGFRTSIIVPKHQNVVNNTFGVMS
jgi:hypothetical protein